MTSPPLQLDNVLLTEDESCPGQLVAKLSDFGLHVRLEANFRSSLVRQRQTTADAAQNAVFSVTKAFSTDGTNSSLTSFTQLLHSLGLPSYPGSRPWGAGDSMTATHSMIANHSMTANPHAVTAATSVAISSAATTASPVVVGLVEQHSLQAVGRLMSSEHQPHPVLSFESGRSSGADVLDQRNSCSSSSPALYSTSGASGSALTLEGVSASGPSGPLNQLVSQRSHALSCDGLSPLQVRGWLLLNSEQQQLYRVY